MATQYQLMRLRKLETALKRILHFAQSRDPRTGSFRSGNQISPDAFRKASTLTGYRGPTRPRPDFGSKAAAVAPAARPRNLKADVLAALRARKPAR